MSYIGIDLDNLCWEIKSLMRNNYNGLDKSNIKRNFTFAKNDILETIRDIINQNKADILEEIKEDLI